MITGHPHSKKLHHVCPHRFYDRLHHTSQSNVTTNFGELLYLTKAQVCRLIYRRIVLIKKRYNSKWLTNLMARGAASFRKLKKTSTDERKGRRLQSWVHQSQPHQRWPLLAKSWLTAGNTVNSHCFCNISLKRSILCIAESSMHYCGESWDVCGGGGAVDDGNQDYCGEWKRWDPR